MRFRILPAIMLLTFSTVKDQTNNATCPAPSSYSIGIVQTCSAYFCRGELQKFLNVTIGRCVDAQNFTTARGYRRGDALAGHECTFNYYSSAGCYGPFTSTRSAADGSKNWAESIRHFMSLVGEEGAYGLSFMYVCYPRSSK
ncbi:uncharacterized protein BDZ99DRAFT_192850 [Mytilinidion resinicola]|uniref:Uncharacterized protein n=1 Tax=Mytilinidion resinicola TaxID=574789 RepID=A0A6A6Z339_9PEZI|nr:uncharacterized protein BDZ99DRAFT_192850 [Mytilinidion resinicola]KAF2815238.1 hypothetical protein BDZ99DRAFT_192850 [Mytilinidion resinicola]